jgi:MFS family permease
LTKATFGVGFFMRPVGGILLGIYADRRGRKAALRLIIGLMTAAIAMIAFAPTYAAIGVAAPLIIVLARLLQGFATGGEFASATAFLIESAPAHRRGFYGSWQMVGQGAAVLTGALVSALVTRGLAPDALDGWGCGFAQFIVTWLIQATGSPIAPAFYVMLGTATGLVAAFFLVDRTREVRLLAVETVMANIGPE